MSKPPGKVSTLFHGNLTTLEDLKRNASDEAQKKIRYPSNVIKPGTEVFLTVQQTLEGKVNVAHVPAVIAHVTYAFSGVKWYSLAFRIEGTELYVIADPVFDEAMINLTRPKPRSRKPNLSLIR